MTWIIQYTMKYLFLVLTFFSSVFCFSQIELKKYDTILPYSPTDTFQYIIEDYFNNYVEKISIVELHPHFNFFEYRKFLEDSTSTVKDTAAWVKENSYVESVILSKWINCYKLYKSFDNCNEEEYLGFDYYFIKSEVFLDSNDIKNFIVGTFSKKERQNDTIPRVIDMCYNPRHAFLFYDENDQIIGVYEVCFECRNNKLALKYVEAINGEIRNIHFALFKKHEEELVSNRKELKFLNLKQTLEYYRSRRVTLPE